MCPGRARSRTSRRRGASCRPGTRTACAARDSGTAAPSTLPASACGSGCVLQAPREREQRCVLRGDVQFGEVVEYLHEPMRSLPACSALGDSAARRAELSHVLCLEHVGRQQTHDLRVARWCPPGCRAASSALCTSLAGPARRRPGRKPRPARRRPAPRRRSRAVSRQRRARLPAALRVSMTVHHRLTSAQAMGRRRRSCRDRRISRCAGDVLGHEQRARRETRRPAPWPW